MFNLQKFLQAMPSKSFPTLLIKHSQHLWAMWGNYTYSHYTRREAQRSEINFIWWGVKWEDPKIKRLKDRHLWKMSCSFLSSSQLVDKRKRSTKLQPECRNKKRKIAKKKEGGKVSFLLMIKVLNWTTLYWVLCVLDFKSEDLALPLGDNGKAIKLLGPWFPHLWNMRRSEKMPSMLCHSSKSM